MPTFTSRGGENVLVSCGFNVRGGRNAEVVFFRQAHPSSGANWGWGLYIKFHDESVETARIPQLTYHRELAFVRNAAGAHMSLIAYICRFAGVSLCVA